MAEHFTIDGQRPVQDVTPGGVFEEAIEVTFTTKPHHVAGRVRIPKAMYTVDQVAEVVGAQAALLESVAEL